jgi:hypothetical protein
MFAAVKPTPPEKLYQARNRRHAAKVVTALTFNQGRVRGRRVMFPDAAASLTTAYARSLRREIPDAVMAIWRSTWRRSPMSTARKASGSPRAASPPRPHGDLRSYR